MGNPRTPGKQPKNKNKQGRRQFNVGGNKNKDKASVVVNVQGKVPKVKPRGVEPKLALCTQKFALACADPFHPAARGACIPSNNGSTMKAHGFARFAFQTNASGDGMLYVLPSVANNLPQVVYTGATSTNVVNPWSTHGTTTTAGTLNTGWSTLVANVPFSGDLFVNSSSSTSVVGKVVAAGLRVQYVGTTLNQGGIYYGFHSPAHSSLAGATDAQIGSFGDTQVVGVNRKPFTLNLFPVKADEMTFPTLAANAIAASGATASVTYPFSSTSSIWADTWGSVGTAVYSALGTTVTPVGSPIGAIAISGPANSSFHCEYIVHVEYEGNGAGSMLTPNSSDMQGAEAVMAAASRAQTLRTSQPERSNASLMAEALRSLAREAMPVAVDLLNAYKSARGQGMLM